MPARWIIHTVGPVWRGGRANEAQLLASCYRSSMAEAERLGAATMAFPAISCGAYRYPLEDATAIAVREVGILESEGSLTEVWFCCLDPQTLGVYERELAARAVELLP